MKRGHMTELSAPTCGSGCSPWGSGRPKANATRCRSMRSRTSAAMQGAERSVHPSQAADCSAGQKSSQRCNPSSGWPSRRALCSICVVDSAVRALGSDPRLRLSPGEETLEDRGGVAIDGPTGSLPVVVDTRGIPSSRHCVVVPPPAPVGPLARSSIGRRSGSSGGGSGGGSSGGSG